jgi:hypothetical protein
MCESSALNSALAIMASHYCSRYRCKMMPEACVAKRVSLLGALVCRGCSEGVDLSPEESQAAMKPVINERLLERHPDIFEKLPARLPSTCPGCGKERMLIRTYVTSRPNSVCPACQARGVQYRKPRKTAKRLCKTCGETDPQKFEQWRRGVCLKCRKDLAKESMRKTRERMKAC